MLRDIHWREAVTIFRHCQLFRVRTSLILVGYYIVALLGAILEGAGLVLLVDLVTGRVNLSEKTPILNYIVSILNFFSIPSSFQAVYFFLIFLFIVRVAFVLISIALDGYLEANLRRVIQEKAFSRVLSGDWQFLRSMQVGKYVGAITEESTNVAKYYMSVVKAGYSIIAAAVLGLTALWVSPEVTVLFAGVGIPILLILRYLFQWQAKIITMMVKERQGLYASITEHLHGLFQIKVTGEMEQHFQRGLTHQAPLTSLEIKYGNSRAIINAFNQLLPALMLLAFYLWSAWKGEPLQQLVFILAGIGIIGARALAQVNNAIASIGNLTSFSGSILPVHQLFIIPREVAKRTISENLAGIDLQQVSYRYESHGIQNITLRAEIGHPLILMGPSGSGKTTLANLMAGVYQPNEGVVNYEGISGKQYNSKEFKPRIGYVTQDIHLFQGSIRDNLYAAELQLNDDALWDCLKMAGAEEYVRKMGGLDAMIAEAGRSLSGGERRRLGIARVLAKKPDILILDEVTTGLDEKRRGEILQTINELSKSMVVIIITHDKIHLDSANFWTFNAQTNTN